MPADPEDKVQIITDYRRHEKDSGSPEIQIALLTERILAMTEHMKDHKHDYSSRRGLLAMVSKRNKLLKYLATRDRAGYQKLIKSLNLRK